ncbi:MAG: class IV adenylate cyclase [Nanoarchaeota archaeon]|nr:class IV adenylate cyclase [Nanoarchaeota archaeon]
MAHEDIEVEIKLQLTEKQFLSVQDKLKQIAEAKKASHQIDDYFTPAHRDFLKYDYPYEWLRIGQRSGKTILNYKHFHPENTMPFTHCDEFETEVACPEKLRKIFASLDILPLVTVDKQRSTFVFNDEFEIVLDTVKELGCFMEIETIKDFGSIEQARRRIREFSALLGIDPEGSVERGYPYLLMEKKGLLK